MYLYLPSRPSSFFPYLLLGCDLYVVQALTMLFRDQITVLHRFLFPQNGDTSDLSQLLPTTRDIVPTYVSNYYFT